ncbi:Polynucleotide 5'-hydroxyl-kinase grc3 [Parahypoxylon ruwenzoriense]
MSTNKRRRLDVTEPPKAMSAFALRKRLLNQQPAPGQPEINTVDEVDAIPPSLDVVGTSRTRSSKKISREQNVQPVAGREDDPSASLNHLPLEDQSKSICIPIEHPGALESSPPPSTIEDEAPAKVKNSPVQLSKFTPSKNNYQRRKDGRILLKLSDGERLVILGSYGIHVTSGEVTINGATLRSSDKPHWVDAPYCHALPVIRCADAAALELLSHPSAPSLKSLGRLSPQFRKLWNETNENSTSPETTFQILYTSADGPKRAMLQDLVSPPEWNREIAKLLSTSNSKPCSFMITGPKSSGKSTFGKILANRLITDRSNETKRRTRGGVAVLDLDPGQPEYCVAGQVALVLLANPVFSPSFCHPVPCSDFRIVRSHALASISPASDPELYLEAALDLMTYYRNCLALYPLIINTPGWIQGTGLDLLTSLITGLRPAEVVYMSESGPTEAVESLQEACKVSGFSTLPSQATQLTARTAAHLRAMQTMSYFHVEPSSTDINSCRIQWNPKPLTTVSPWQVTYRGSDRGIFAVMCYDYQAPPELLADAINGTILAAVAVESTKALRCSTECTDLPMGHDANNGTGHMMDLDDDDDDNDNDDAQKAMSSPFSSLANRLVVETPEGIPFIDTTNGITLDPKYSHSIGLVLVRGIDVEKGALQLLTPISSESIEEVTSRGGEIVLVSGKFDTPSWAYTEELYYRANGECDEDADVDEGSGDDSSDDENTNWSPLPWIEAHQGNRKRGAGSKVWRVRRDLGRGGNTAD